MSYVNQETLSLILVYMYDLIPKVSMEMSLLILQERKCLRGLHYYKPPSYTGANISNGLKVN